MYKDKIENLSKQITGTNMMWDEIKVLDNQQQKLLFEQMQRFVELKESESTNTEYHINEDGKLVLQQGTLLHGVRAWTTDILQEISRTGIISSEFSKGLVEDAETFYSADFWRVDSELTMQEYTNKFFKDKEGSFLPLRRMDKTNKIAFVINSNNPNIQELLAYDAFRDVGDSSKLSRSIISEGHFNRYECMKDRLSAVLFGIPSNLFSGIIIGKRLLEEMPEKIEEIKKIFPGLYIATQEGELIYEPNKEKSQELPISSDTKKSVENIARTSISRDVQRTSSEIKEGYKELENPTQTREDSVSLND